MATLKLGGSAGWASAALREGLTDILLHEGWKLLRKSDKSEYTSALDFIEHPDGLNSSISDIAAAVAANAAATKLLCDAERALHKNGEVGRGRGNSLDGVKAIETQGGNSQEYIVRRLKREHFDDLAAEVIQGTRSAASARKAAGFGPSSVSVSLHENPTKAAKTLVDKLGAERALELAAAITSQARDVAVATQRKSPKDLIREAGRLLDVAETEIEKVCELVGDWPTISDALDHEPDFAMLYHKSEVHRRWINTARTCIDTYQEEHNP